MLTDTVRLCRMNSSFDELMMDIALAGFGGDALVGGLAAASKIIND